MKFIGIWILNPLKSSGGQPMAFGGFRIWLGGYFFSWILIIDPWVLSPEIPVAARKWCLDCPETQTTKSHKPAQFNQTCLGSLMVNGSTQ